MPSPPHLLLALTVLACAAKPATNAPPSPVVPLKARAEAAVPEGLRAQLRELTGVATGGRYALVPASLALVRDRSGRGRADLVVSLVDVRRGVVSWTTISSGIGDDPWNAIAGAARSLTAEEARS